jgi:hypothetical protein
LPHGGRDRTISQLGASDFRKFQRARDLLGVAPMSRKPASYGEILERTVPDPSGAFAPSRDERRQAAHRNDPAIHPMRPHEHHIAQEIRTALIADTRIVADLIEIVVQSGVVYLTGRVAGPGTLALIEDVSGRVHGVVRVISDLVVSGGEP